MPTVLNWVPFLYKSCISSFQTRSAINLPLLLARRLLRHHRGTFSAFIIRLAIAATALSVAVMIVALSLIGGFKQTIRSKLFSFWGEVLIVPFDPAEADIGGAIPVQWDSVFTRDVTSIKGVRSVTPFVLRPAILQSSKELEGVRLRGITAATHFPRSITFTGNSLRFSDTAYAPQIILSKRTAERLNISVGGILTLYFITGGGPRIRKLTVAGTYHTGMEEIDRQYALCDIRLVQRLAGWSPEELSGYAVRIADNEQSNQMADSIYQRFITPPLSARSIPEIYAGVFDWLATLDNNGRLLLLIVGIVAIINLASAMLILMVDRAVMIGLLKTLGMGPRALWAVFGYVAALIAGLGIVLGNILGVGLCLLQRATGFVRLAEETYNTPVAPVRIVWWHVAALDGAALAVCVLCAALPLLYLRRIQPARVLQFG